MRARTFLIGLGVGSFLLYLGIAYLSRRFNWGEGYEQRPILEYLAVYFALFALYAAACWRLWKRPEKDRRLFWIVIAFGLLFRAAIFPAQQIQEDDVYRYLWDGKVFSNGINPFEYAPAEVREFIELKIREPDTINEIYDERNQRELEKLRELKWENQRSLTFLERVNHPEVPTIYPPMAQYVFRLVQTIQQDSILTLRAAFLAFDLMALVFIVLILRATSKDENLCVIYFWSPLLIKETFNSTHLDIIGISLLCGSIYFLVRSRSALATLFLALSVLGKLYPAILLPLYLQRSARQCVKEGRSPWMRPGLEALLFIAVIVVFYLPFVNTGMATFEGLKAFSTYWQSNDSLFSILMFIYGDLFRLGAENQEIFSQDAPTFFSKATVASILLGVLCWLLWKRPSEDDSNAIDIRNLFIVMALVFLLSPVQNPWYLCWVIPFMVLMPKRAWIFLTGLVGLYYLDFYFDYQEIQQYTPWIPWVEYPPFYLLLIWDLWGKKWAQKLRAPQPAELESKK